MDNFVKKLLEDWQCQEFISIFESEGIDEESFKLLDDETIKILIPKAGARLKFKKLFVEFNQKSSANIQVPMSESVPSIVSHENIQASGSCESNQTSGENTNASLSSEQDTTAQKKLNLKVLVKSTC